MGQSSYFESIPESPTEFTDVNVMQRLIDGLGYRYHWASQDLREEDLNYNPGNEGKTTMETLVHLYDLSESIRKVVFGFPLMRPLEKNEMEYEEIREASLRNLWEAREKLNTLESLEDLEVTFKRGEKTSSFPIWNLINGQISDAIYHTGQIVSFRRSSGNPMSPTVNVFLGKSRR